MRRHKPSPSWRDGAVLRALRRWRPTGGKGPMARALCAQRKRLKVGEREDGESRPAQLARRRGARRGDVRIGLFGRDLPPGHMAMRGPDWNNRMHDGAVGPAADMKSAAQLPHTRGHAGNADAGGKTLALDAVFRRLQAMSIIPDDDVNAIAPAP